MERTHGSFARKKGCSPCIPFPVTHSFPAFHRMPCDSFTPLTLPLSLSVCRSVCRCERELNSKHAHQAGSWTARRRRRSLLSRFVCEKSGGERSAFPAGCPHFSWNSSKEIVQATESIKQNDPPTRSRRCCTRYEDERSIKRGKRKSSNDVVEGENRTAS